MTEPTPCLMLVDDDAQLATMLHDFMELHGFKVVMVGDGETALDRLAEIKPDLIILDVMLPGMNGFDVLEKLRQTQDLPVIMLTARGEEQDRILGLMRGADDYLPKPFNPLELAVRVKAILKRAGGSTKISVDELKTGPLELNLSRKECHAHGKAVALTAAEMSVLEQLLHHPDEVISRARLTELALHRPIEAYDRSIDTLISKLRRKLSSAGVNKDCIRSLRGHGYVLDTDSL
ncbi:MAG: response regulator transcription factor [Gammaproteobacteria bacterium]|nr:response regulator transcription factor [Gammaproteobacteria bacterium]MCP4089420.1 response regulator transcription factor [Gammaproteobacteria bacterium]MCP4277535.1 response regulator transcription factor [Gammaproteobacteria bacterium]MCP4831143.1 response regulator transcription factor [Gammaproteobacteria bacterium]MCP4928566.1 response regulator transcription factor [Gammaproteobacteria bacterium]